jgi:hypothetical protein
VSFTRKSDVKNHLSALGRVGAGPFLSLTHPDATGPSAPESTEVKSDPAGFAEDFIAEHAPHGISLVHDASTGPKK